MSIQQVRHVKEFDGLRGILALWVVVSHIVCLTGFADFKFGASGSRAWFDLVYARPAVETFIILSGFAIAALVHTRQEGYLPYLKRRFLRIYPTYFVCLVVATMTLFAVPTILRSSGWHQAAYLESLKPLVRSEHVSLTRHMLSHLILLHGMVPHAFLSNAEGTILPPAWSVTLEWQFYLAAPLLLLLLKRPHGLLGMVVLVMVGAKLAPWFQNPHQASLFFWLPLFVLGMLSFKLYRFCEAPDTLAVTQNAGGWVAVVMILIAVTTVWYPSTLIIWGVIFGSSIDRGTGPLSSAMKRIRGMLLHPRAQFMGRISYPLYLIHWPVIISMLFLTIKAHPSVQRTPTLLLLVIVGIPFSVLCAYGIHRLIEKPYMTLGKRLSERNSIAFRPMVAMPT